MAVRIPSLVAGILLLPVIGRLVGIWTNSAPIGLFAAALVSLDQHLIFYSQEARPYALLLLAAWCHVAIVWKLSRKPTIALGAAFIVGTVILFHLHYTAALFCAGEVMFLAIVAARPSPTADSPGVYRVQQLFVDLVIVALACAPVAWHVMAIYAHRGDWSSFVPEPSWTGLLRLYRLDIYVLLPLAALLGSLFNS